VVIFLQWLSDTAVTSLMKVGDLVLCHPSGITIGYGIIIGFAKKGEGGKDFVDVLLGNGEIITVFSFDAEVLNEKKNNKRNR